jgi:hypothetical protein
MNSGRPGEKPGTFNFMGIIEIKAEYLTTFHTFEDWVNKAQSRIGGFGAQQQIVCIDEEGNYCHQGEDMMMARDKGWFPVKAYRLIRVKESIK